MDLGSLPCLHANHAGVAPRPLAEKNGPWPPTARCPRNKAWRMCGSVSGLPPPRDKLARRLEIVTTISAVSMKIILVNLNDNSCLGGYIPCLSVSTLILG